MLRRSAVGEDRDGRARDAVILACIVVLSTVAYVGRLGFYSDDWGFLRSAHFAPAQTLGAVFAALYKPDIQMRPGQVGFFALLYQFFGLHPLGYHIVILACATLAAVLLYFFLRALPLPRDVSFATAALYGLAPNYSADRIWIASVQATTSFVLALGAALCALAAVDGDRHRRGFVAFALAALVLEACSIVTYEVAMPLFLGFALLVWLRGRRAPAAAALAVGTILVLLAGAGFKAALSARFIDNEYLPNAPHPSRWVVLLQNLNYTAHEIVHGLVVNAGYEGALLPYAAAKLAFLSHAWTAVILGILAGVAVYVALRRTGTRNPTLSDPLPLLELAAIAYVLGYAIFLTNTNVGFTPTGLDDRTGDVATVGVALAIVAIAWAIARRFPSLDRRLAYALVAAYCACGAVASGAITSYWAAAAVQQAAVLHALRADVPVVPKGTTILLDGVCPYVGPGVVFEGDWDTTGALGILYNEPGLHGDVLTANSTVGASAIEKHIYGVTYRYAWSPSLIVYDFALRRRLHGMRDVARATAGNVRRCPPGSEGFGSPLL